MNDEIDDDPDYIGFDDDAADAAVCVICGDVAFKKCYVQFPKDPIDDDDDWPPPDGQYFLCHYHYVNG